MAVELRIIAHEVLHCGADTLTLHSLDVTHRYSCRQKWILPKVLEISSAPWSPINVHAWSEEEMYATSPRVLPKDLSHTLCKFRIPGGGQGDATDRRGRSVISNANRAIGHP